MALSSPNEGNIGLGGFGHGLGHSNRVVIVSGTSFTERLWSLVLTILQISKINNYPIYTNVISATSIIVVVVVLYFTC